MKKKPGLTLILTILCFLMSALLPWRVSASKPQKININILKTTAPRPHGLLELKDGTYYL